MFRDQVKFPFKRAVARLSILAGLFFALMPAGCTVEKEGKDVLSEEKMIKVLMEMYIAESKASRMGIAYDSTKVIFPKFEAMVFEKMDVSDSVFKKSMQYYFAHPKRLERIYSAVVDSLNLKAQSAAAHALPE
jgi:hypothetical protein